MILSAEDGKLFQELFLQLLLYTNKERRLYKMPKDGKGLRAQQVLDLSMNLWEDISIIDRFLKDHEDLPEEKKEIVAGWKRRIEGVFVIERYLKRGTIFIAEKDSAVYQVSGVTNSYEEMFEGKRLPLRVKTVLLPFRDMIITDGILFPDKKTYTKAEAEELKKVYMTAKTDLTLKKEI